MTPLAYERRIQLLALAAGFPGSLIAMILLWHGNYSSGTVWTLAFLIFPANTLESPVRPARRGLFNARSRGAQRRRHG